nr:protein aspartic protease in guard cell 2 [Quercus suber]
MKRDAKRVVHLINRMEQVDFVGEVMSGVNEGIVEYIIPIEVGSPPIAQHVIMDIFHLTESGDRGVIMDSGTITNRFPKVAYEAFCDAFIAQTMDIP